MNTSRSARGGLVRLPPVGLEEGGELAGCGGRDRSRTCDLVVVSDDGLTAVPTSVFAGRRRPCRAKLCALVRSRRSKAQTDTSDRPVMQSARRGISPCEYVAAASCADRRFRRWIPTVRGEVRRSDQGLVNDRLRPASIAVLLDRHARCGDHFRVSKRRGSAVPFPSLRGRPSPSCDTGAASASGGAQRLTGWLPSQSAATAAGFAPSSSTRWFI